MNNTEIERRWLITEAGVKSLLKKYKENVECMEMETYFHIFGDSFIRIRRIEGGEWRKFKLCIKSGHGVTRIEVEKEINEDSFYSMKKDFELFSTCTAYHVTGIDGLHAIDIKLIPDCVPILEVEFGDEESAKEFKLSSIFRGTAIDVSGNPQYEYINIVRSVKPATQYLLSAIKPDMTMLFPKITKNGDRVLTSDGKTALERYEIIQRYLVPVDNAWQWHWVTKDGKEIIVTIIPINNQTSPEKVYTFINDGNTGFIDDQTFKANPIGFQILDTGKIAFWQNNRNPLHDNLTDKFVWVIRDKVENEDELMSNDISHLYKDTVFQTK